MKKAIVHVIDSNNDNAILFVGEEQNELKRFPKENFQKNKDTVSIFYYELKELQEKGFMIFFE